ncbi:MAG: hypothetical protein ABTQ73_11050 [Caldilineales bacterium]
MNTQRIWQRLRQRTCERCAFADMFRSNGDGQVTRLHTFCRNNASPYYNRPVPPERTCPAWQRRSGPQSQPDVGDPTLTA